MERDRSWRRYKEDVIVIKRLKISVDRNNHWNLKDANGYFIDNPIWCDIIGSHDAHRYKTFVTTKWDSRYKDKWGKKNILRYYNSDYDTRKKDKVRYKKELNAIGLKHLPTKFKSELDY
jgi:hypothetical protein